MIWKIIPPELRPKKLSGLVNGIPTIKNQYRWIYSAFGKSCDDALINLLEEFGKPNSELHPSDTFLKGGK